MPLSIIFLNFEFLENFTFCTFGKHAKDTKFINDIPHTQKYRYTQKHVHIDTDTIFCIFHFLAHLA